MTRSNPSDRNAKARPDDDLRKQRRQPEETFRTAPGLVAADSKGRPKRPLTPAGRVIPAPATPPKRPNRPVGR